MPQRLRTLFVLRGKQLGNPHSPPPIARQSEGVSGQKVKGGILNSDTASAYDTLEISG